MEVHFGTCKISLYKKAHIEDRWDNTQVERSNVEQRGALKIGANAKSNLEDPAFFATVAADDRSETLQMKAESENG
jgi:hypothetical protein